MEMIRIVPPEPDEMGVTRAQGTKVYVGDQEVTGVIRVETAAEVNGLWVATITVYARPPKGVSYVGRVLVRPFHRWWHRFLKPKVVDTTDLSDFARRYRVKGDG